MPLAKCRVPSLAMAAALALLPQEARAISCVSGPFIIYFEPGRDRLTASAKAMLGDVLRAYGTCGIGGRIFLAGHADRTGSPNYNHVLSSRRAERVRAFLDAQGIPAESLVLAASGESRPLFETADGVGKAENRRVEIIFGPGLGE